jgi:hypothetical protein
MKFAKRNSDLDGAQACASSPAHLSSEEKLMLLQLLEPEAWSPADLAALARDYDPRVRSWAGLVLALAMAGARRDAA